MLNGMITSIQNVSGGGSVSDVYSDKTDDNYGIGESLAFHADAEDNIALGENALNSTSGAALRNIGIGKQALTSINTGDSNTGIGAEAGKGLAAQTGNTIVGTYSLNNSSAQINNAVVVGYSALKGDLTTAADSTIAIGVGSLQALTSGGGNIGIGYQAMLTHTIGANNIAIGHGAMNDTDATFTDNTRSADIVGGGSSATIILDGANGSLEVGQSVTGSGIPDNAYIASIASTSDPATFDIDQNIGGTISGNTTLTFSGALASQDNIFIGKDSGGGTWSNLSNNYNTAIGNYTLDGALLHATSNTVVGYQAGGAITHSNYCTYVGAQAGSTNDDGSYNVGVGAETLNDSAVGDNNVALGYKAANKSKSSNNVAIGSQALLTMETGHSNVAIGYAAMYDTNAGPNSKDSDWNVAIGRSTMGGAWANTGSEYNTAVGGNSLPGALDGANNNACYGYSSGLGVTEGENNTLLGAYSGENITTGSRNIIIGFHTHASGATVNDEIVIGSGADTSNQFTGGGTDTIRIGRAAEYMEGDLTANTWVHGSDVRIKREIENCNLGLGFINSLRMVTYKKKALSEYPKTFNAYNPNETKSSDRKYYGFIAQEVKKAMDEAGYSDFSMWNESQDGMQTLSEGSLVMPLVKAVQELSQQIEDLKKG